MKRLLLLVPTSTYRASAFVRAAHRLTDVALTIASEEPSAFSPLQPEELITLDFSDPDHCAEQAVRYADRFKLDAVVPADDQAVPAAAAICAALNLPGHPIDAAHAARNKLTMRNRLKEHNVPQPNFRSVSLDTDPKSVAAQVSYPVVLKPLAMAASRGVIRADNEQEFINAFNRIIKLLLYTDDHTKSILVEEYLPNWEVAVEGIVTDGKLRVLAIFDKPDSPEGPVFPESIYVTPSNLSLESQQRIKTVTQQAVTALQLNHGPIHAELRGSSDKPALLEIAARSIGGHCSKVLHFNGVTSLEELILRHGLAEPVDQITLEETVSGVMMIQPHTEGIFQKAQ
ncbi:MAG: ATP-grasp domain-containing protein, partial [Planctomycetes bacterium]|nr:ATP-grasp domain-containing protein [Planctomycetota bacterium]